uniref:Uncharacterized protein n=1 Tax=Anguilla anguilla TaxID=7936 RepID=A0A0E9PEC6_ANGAN
MLQLVYSVLCSV